MQHALHLTDANDRFGFFEPFGALENKPQMETIEEKTVREMQW